jgi:hypothetical protein
MRVSEHANYFLNEYGRLQFDYAAYCKPYGESLRNEARNNLEEYIAELEEENDRLQAAWFEDETICPDGSLKPIVSTLLSRIAKLKAEVTKCHELQDSYCDRIAELEAFIDRLIEVSEKMFTAVIAAADSYDEGMREWDKIVNDWKEG